MYSVISPNANERINFIIALVQSEWNESGSATGESNKNISESKHTNSQRIIATGKVMYSG